MFGKRIRLFSLFGFPISIDLSWLILAVLVAWSLKSTFANRYAELANNMLWAMGVAGALGLFVSIVLHEFSHAMAARANGMEMRGITLFIFGGVAEMDQEPPSPKAEFVMAIAGPIASVVIAVFCIAAAQVGSLWGWPTPVTAVLAYLGWINAALAVFNLVPAFPLDGGRVLRAALWYVKGSLRWATRIGSSIGSVFGILLIVLGVVRFVAGDFIGGMWWFLIGMFVRNAAQMSYQQLLVRRVLEGEPVQKLMHRDPITVTPGTTVRQLVDDYIYQYHHKMFPVVDDGHLVGCVTTRDVQQVPRTEWDAKHVEDIAADCSGTNTIAASADAMEALSKMNQTGKSRLMVVKDQHLAGIIALKDVLQYLSIKAELERDLDSKQAGHKEAARIGGEED